MELINLYAELQINPKNTRVYRKLLGYYLSQNDTQKAKAFENLMKEKFGSNNIHSDQKQ